MIMSFDTRAALPSNHDPRLYRPIFVKRHSRHWKSTDSRWSIITKQQWRHLQEKNLRILFGVSYIYESAISLTMLIPVGLDLGWIGETGSESVKWTTRIWLYAKFW